MSRKPFYLSRHKDVWYARIIDQKTGKEFIARSTGQTNRDLAVMTVSSQVSFQREFTVRQNLLKPKFLLQDFSSIFFLTRFASMKKTLRKTALQKTTSRIEHIIWQIIEPAVLYIIDTKGLFSRFTTSKIKIDL